ncbi:MAG: ATP-dependent DNA helicase RecG [Rhodothalassiaceae bacterium]
MRPPRLFPLFADISALPGVGPRNRALFERVAGGGRVIDLLWHLPTGLVDRRRRPKIAEARPGEVVTIAATVDRHQPGATRRQPYRVLLRDESGFLTLTFFHPREDWLRRVLPVGELRIVSGRLELFQERPQITHPDYILPPEEAAALPELEPLYPLTQGLTQKRLRQTMEAALGRAPDLPEWISPDLLAREGWQGWKESLVAAHAPGRSDDLAPTHPARRRLAYDELLANQLALALVRHRARRRKGRALQWEGRLKARLLDALPYALTGDQARAVAEIEADLRSGIAMLRLVQGDVGSGKTVVALLAMLDAVEAGGQAALLAPTEILARQHADTLGPLAAAVGVRLALHTGRQKGRARELLLAELRAGEIDILVGTHALLTEDVAFSDLALVVIDEQHRFGVFQRLALAEKAGHAVDTLVMTATPIPRTLTLTAYGDMDVSRIVEKPPGRKPVDTRVIALERLDEVVARLERAAGAEAQAFWICPLVAESEDSDLAAAEARHEMLRERLGDRVGLVHGRMKGREKDRVMAAFAAGRIAVLVATTVVEVGVDVPGATIMVIEHAERFGLAQLHQLRGRIGRGAAPATCLLLRAGQLGEAARARLQILRETNDGFRIAEEDLRLRGAGELLGTRQSGLPEFRLVDLENHADLMAIAHDDARLVIARDPGLASARGTALRHLLCLFERDAAVRFLKGG